MQPFYYQDDRDVRQPIGMTLREVCESLTPDERKKIIDTYEPLAWRPLTRQPLDSETTFWRIFQSDRHLAAFQNCVFNFYWSKQ
jgi:hypothetical protein